MNKVQSVSALNKAEPARAKGLAGAAVALGRDASLIWINPASPVGTDSLSLSVGGQQGMFGERSGQTVAAGPVEPGILTAGFVYYDTGSVDLQNPEGRTWQVIGQQDFLGALGFAMPFTNRASAGFSVKYLHSELAEKFVASSVDLDAGIQFQYTDSFKVGASLRNVGTGYKYKKEKTPPPSTVTAGMAMIFLPAATFGYSLSSQDIFLLVVDGEATASGEPLSLRGGVEYQTFGMLTLRGGARFSGEEGMRAYSAGIGILARFNTGENTLTGHLDYAIDLGNSLIGLPQMLNLTVEFGPPPALPAPAQPPETPADEDSVPAPEQPPAQAPESLAPEEPPSTTPAEAALPAESPSATPTEILPPAEPPSETPAGAAPAIRRDVMIPEPMPLPRPNIVPEESPAPGKQ